MTRKRLTALAGVALAGALAPAIADSAPEPAAPKLGLPIACRPGQTCEVQNYLDRDPGPGAQDWRCGARTYQNHNGVDFRILDMGAQRRGVAVLAAAAGKVSRLRDGVQDISVKAPGAPPLNGQDCGNGLVIDHGGGWETQYCHMAKGSLSVKAGDAVAAGQPIGKVGLSGNTEYPHLHLTVRRAGVVVDPFAPKPGAACGAGGPGLWTDEAGRLLAYQTGAVLNAGFADRPVSNDDVEAGGLSAPQPGSGVLLAYVRAIGLKAGDTQHLVLTGPKGEVVAETRIPALDRDKAQYLLYAGRKRPPAGWPPGTYTARYEVTRAGAAAIRRTFTLRL